MAAFSEFEDYADADDINITCASGVFVSNVIVPLPFQPCSDDKDAAWKIFGGYQFNRNLGVEFGYTNLGKASAGDAVSTTTFKTKGFEVLAVGTFPINQQFEVYGKAGLFRWNLDANDTVFGSLSESGTDLTFGLGVKYNFTKTVGARLEWQRYNDIGNENTTGTSDSDFIGVGLVFKF